jgi:ABC-type sugar transport system ATPase subunit
VTTPRLLITGVRKAFGSTPALCGVNLSMAAGEVHASRSKVA